jgi:uncharacterized protein
MAEWGYLAGYLAALFMGASLGLVGGGGSLLTVPVLVYLMGVPPSQATSESLFVVGMVSLIGALRSMRKGQLSYRTALLFALPSFTAVWLTRHFVVPHMPDVLLSVRGRDLTSDIAFAVSLIVGVLFAAFLLLRTEMREHPSAKRVVALMLPAAATVFVIRQFLIPRLPDHLLILQSFSITKDRGLMLLFAGIMVAAAYAMLRTPKPTEDESHAPNADAEANAEGSHPLSAGAAPTPFLRLGSQGLLVGLVTGLVGAGGGFLIVPALVLMADLPMRRAVGTSLLIITINSLVGFASHATQESTDWNRLLLFTALATVGIWLGARNADRLPNRILRTGFAYGVMLLAGVILVREIFFA